MADVGDGLWRYNFRRVVVVDVSDDYRFFHPPMPASMYPVLDDVLLPVHGLFKGLGDRSLVDGYLYDWHESPDRGSDPLYVGVVDRVLLPSSA